MTSIHRSALVLSLSLFAAACGTVMTEPPEGDDDGGDGGGDDGEMPDADPSQPPPPDAPPDAPPEPVACTGGDDCDAGQACNLSDGICVPAQLMFDVSSFHLDGTGRAWTVDSGPTITGTLDAPSGATVRAYVGADSVGSPATIAADTWTIDLPAGTIQSAGTTIIIRIVEANTIEVARTFVHDPTGPTIAIPPAAQVRDERQDDIDFDTGVPRHDHVGPQTSLSSGCPTVYKHAYLMDADAPAYGIEYTPNPLRWLADVDDALATDSIVEYRVRRQSGTVELDWTPLTGGTSQSPSVTRFAVVMRRSGSNSIAALGTEQRGYEIDFRVVDWAGRVAQVEGCWNHVPLAAPLEISSSNLVVGGLTSFTLPANSPIGNLLNTGGLPVPVVETRIIQRSSEPVRFEATLAGTGGTYSLLPVADYVDNGTMTNNTVCDISCDDGTCSEYHNEAPICQPFNPLDPTDVTRNGTLASGSWSVAIVADNGDSIACEPMSGPTARCTIPARTGAAVTYRVVASVRELTDLRPFGSATYGEHTAFGLTFTGKAPTTIQRCVHFHASTVASTTTVRCTTVQTLTYIQALDQASVSFGARSLQLRSSPSMTIAPTTPPSTPASLALPAIAWNAGNDDLPGPAH